MRKKRSSFQYRKSRKIQRIQKTTSILRRGRENFKPKRWAGSGIRPRSGWLNLRKNQKTKKSSSEKSSQKNWAERKKPKQKVWSRGDQKEKKKKLKGKDFSLLCGMNWERGGK